jgi:hypothetical protein
MPALKNRIEQLERAFPEARSLSQDDKDSLTLYWGCSWLRAGVTPTYRELERTSAYARGRGLADQEEHIELAGSPCGAAWTFELLFGRIPRTGDILSIAHLQTLSGIERYELEQFIGAWSRQLPNMPCPLRFNGGQLLKRTMPTPAGQPPYNPAWPNWPIVWEEYREPVHESPERDWLKITRAAGVDDTASAKCSAVVFLNGTECRPATEQELEEDETFPSGGVLAVVVNSLSRMEEQL